jgi:hypothetical protein
VKGELEKRRRTENTKGGRTRRVSWDNRRMREKPRGRE